MYVVLRNFSAMRSVPEAARRAESGIGQILKQSPGFVAYYVFDGGNGVGGAVTQFEDRGKANAANEKALAWIRGSLFDLIEGDPEIIAGEVLAEGEPSVGLKRRLTLLTRSWSGSAAVEVSCHGCGPRVVPAEMR